jgi:hypothetical protein
VPLYDLRLQFNAGGVSVEGSGEGQPVDVISLDSCGLERCNLTKIDVEGMEGKVLRGAESTIRKTRPPRFVETSRENQAEVIELAHDYGYQCWWHIAAYFSPENFFGNTENVFADIHPQSNRLCVPGEGAFSIDGLERVEGDHDTSELALERIRAKASRD